MLNTNPNSRMSFRELFSLSIIFTLMIAITSMNLVFSNTFGETCGFLHPYIFEAQVSMIDPGGGLNWNSDLTNLPQNERDVRVLDSFLRVYDESGVLLASDDDTIDGDASSGSKIESFSPPESGTVIVEMGSYGDTGSGLYEIAVTSGQQEARETLRLGSSVAGTIYTGEANRIVYPLEVGANEVLMVRLSGVTENQDELDTYLRLYNEDKSELLDENDDFSGLSSTLIVINPEESSAVYQLEVGTYGDGESGNFQVSVEEFVLNTVEGEALQMDSSVSGTINSLERVQHRISLEEGASPVISLAIFDEGGFEVPAVLYIYNETGVVNIYDTIYSGFAISNFTVPSSGEYIFEVATAGDAWAGSYELRIASSSEVSNSLDVVDGDAVTVGSETSGRIELGQRLRYPLSLAAGEGIAAYVSGLRDDGSELDTVLRIVDARGAELASNDDYTGLGSGIVNFSLEEAGTVFLEVASYSDASAGTFTIIVESFELTVVTGDVVTLGTTLEGTISRAQRLRYPISLEAGQNLSVYVNGVTDEGFPLDSVLRIYDANETLLVESLYVPLGSIWLPGIEGFTLEEAGEVFIELATFGDGWSGEFTLYVVGSAAELPANIDESYAPEADLVEHEALDLGETARGEIAVGQIQRYPLDLDAGQSVLIKLSGESSYAQDYPLQAHISLYDLNEVLIKESDVYDVYTSVLTYSNTTGFRTRIFIEVSSIWDSGSYSLEVMANTVDNFEQAYGIEINNRGEFSLEEESLYIAGDILAGERLRYKIELNEGQMIRVNFGGGETVSATAALYSSTNELLNQAYSSSGLPGTLSYQATEKGSYWIELGTYYDNEEGEYELLVLPLYDLGEMAVDGQGVFGELRPNERHQYRLYLEAGQVVDISVRQHLPEGEGLSLFAWSGYALSGDPNAAQQWVSCLEYYGYVVDSAFRVNELGISRFVLGTKIDDLCNPLREACQLEASVKLTEIGQILLYVLLPGLAIILPVITVLILQNDKVLYWVVGLVVVASFVLTSSLLYVHLGTVSGISALQDFGSGIFGGTATGAAIAFMTKVLENFSERKARNQEHRNTQMMQAVDKASENPTP